MIINNKQNKILNNIKNFEGLKMKDAPDYIKNIVKELEATNNREEMYAVLDDATSKTADFICLDDTEFVGNGYKFQCTLKKYTSKLNSQNINLPSGWEFIKIIPIGKSDRAVILTKVKK